MPKTNSRWEETKKLLDKKQENMGNQIRRTVTKKQLDGLLNRWKKNKVYITSATQREAKIQYETLEYF